MKQIIVEFERDHKEINIINKTGKEVSLMVDNKVPKGLIVGKTLQFMPTSDILNLYFKILDDVPVKSDIRQTDTAEYITITIG